MSAHARVMAKTLPRSRLLHLADAGNTGAAARFGA